MRFILTSWFIVLVLQLNAQIHDVNVIKYDLSIMVKDEHDTISAVQEVTFVPKGAQLKLQLDDRNEDGTGMTVSKIVSGSTDLKFKHENDTLYISVPKANLAESPYQAISIHYKGKPADGLVISSNKFGNRTFFGDNWPNRAHLWFPCNDHPSDKALINYSIVAPGHYEVIANGVLEAVINYPNGLKHWRYVMEQPLPTKVMVIGIADFEIDTLKNTKTPTYSYVYPENKTEGFEDMKDATKIMEFMESKIAPYPYSQLANVQSTTRYGGMENAGCIFYDENAITGEHEMETLIAHEIAHQWFGNTASEEDWDHLWLSEGFATFLTNEYILATFGQEAYAEQLIKDQKRVALFYSKFQLPLKDSVSEEIEFKLNPNPYQRGAWVLRMLKLKLGDEAFWKGVKTYYATYQFENATTEDFFRVMQTSAGVDLAAFMEMWLYRSTLPTYSVKWEQTGKKLKLNLTQTQEGESFSGPLEYLVKYKDGSTQLKTIDVMYKIIISTSKVKGKVDCIVLDPNHKLLHLMN